MARQKTTISDQFGSGGDKDGSPEEKFFTDEDIQMDPEWKVIELLRAQIDDITAGVNANDAASGSYADLKKEYITSSGSFSTRVTTNDAKVNTFPAITSKFLNIVGVSINSITYTKFGTLAIVIEITDKLGRTALRSFSIDVDE
tara:strand:- start:223 stop:654 length:432 start_codon:yes stop_codon:yes gene_type:complete